MLIIDNIDSSYGELNVLEGVSLKVEEGELVVLCGSNGSGKTTLLRTIMGFLHPNSGEIRFLDEDISRDSTHEIVKKGVTLVPTERHLFTAMSVRDNLELAAQMLKNKNQENMLKQIYDIFPILHDRKKQIAGTLSGGEQQMLTIARALMSDPKLILIDEPTAGLQPQLVRKAFDLIKRINEEETTVLLTEQNVRQALKIANRAYMLENGRIRMEGKSEEFIENEKVKELYLGI